MSIDAAANCMPVVDSLQAKIYHPTWVLNLLTTLIVAFKKWLFWQKMHVDAKL
jgi:hypothetical protein